MHLSTSVNDIKLDILAVGSLIRDGDVIKEAHSTSTLIRGEMNIIVDTSTPYMTPAIKSSLKALKVLPKEIDAIVLTHAHFDHIGNNTMFPKAKVYVRKEEDMEASVRVDKDMDICKGVRLVHTPGHTAGSMSVFVDADRKYVIAGDAVPTEDNLRKMVPPRVNIDEERAMESIKTIRDYADVIVPGHGFPFMKDM